MAVALCVCAAAQAPQSSSQPEVLDRVEAVVNNQAILTSDIEHELRLSAIDPERGRRRPLTPGRALQLLISRALIQQQIKQTYIEVAEPSEEDVQARIKELREQLPDCVEKNCTTDTGWAAFLKDNDLTEAEVATYIGLRLELLDFIASRFRQGIQISHDQIEKYYRETLLPEYPKGEQAPPLDAVAPRIEEILLQQQVNTLFTSWLRDLRKQGDVEILDQALEPSATSNAEDNR
jgi:peptidyl-prolyl cis-trans isomerase SurA